jgi:hypothetical protein
MRTLETLHDLVLSFRLPGSLKKLHITFFDLLIAEKLATLSGVATLPLQMSG